MHSVAHFGELDESVVLVFAALSPALPTFCQQERDKGTHRKLYEGNE
jgi:hypothetical protein